MPHKRIFLSSGTLDIVNEDIERNIRYFSADYHIPAPLVKAIIKKESDFNFNLIRYEPHLRKAKWYTKWLSKEEKLNPYCFCSFGLMQVMFVIARSYGFKGTPFELLEPKQSIAYGVVHLHRMLQKYGGTQDAVSAYNQGTPRKAKNGDYVNQEYVDTVMRYMRSFGKKG